MTKKMQMLAILLMPIYFVLPVDSHFTVCPFFHLTGLPCPGCGMGRSLIHIFHLNFGEAFYYNPFGFFVAVGQCYLILSFFFPSLVEIYSKQEKFFRASQIPFAIVFISFGLVRIWSFVSGDLFLRQYFYDFTKTFSLIRWLVS